MTGMDKAIEEAKAAVLAFESWERLAGESGLAYAAFCVFRDLGFSRNVRKAVEAGEKDESLWNKRCKVWRNWCSLFRWRERAADYDNYFDKLKQAELRKAIETQGEKHREVTGKMLEVVTKKLDSMNPTDLTPGIVTVWVDTAIRADRDAAGLVNGKDGTAAEPKQGEINFAPDFDGI